MKTLDLLDRRILFELDRDARQSISALARKIKQGRDRVEYRVERLFSEQIVLKSVAAVDVFKLGLSLFKTYLRLENKKSRVAEFITYLRKHPRVYWVALCDGGWDLAVIVFAESAREFYDIHSAILSEYNELVLNFSSYLVVEYRINNRNFLIKAPRSQYRLSGIPVKNPIDNVDFKILRLLAQDARLSALEIADRIRSTAAIVRYRIEHLEKVGIITGYHLDLNLNAVGLQHFKAQFFIRDYKLSLRKQFLEYCNQQPNISFYIEQIGDCNIEIEFEVADYQEYARIIDDIRGEFSGLIRNFNTMLIRESWYSNMPSDPALVID
jgi:DNA-binding Lrp family transcriptional regulator